MPLQTKRAALDDSKVPRRQGAPAARMTSNHALRWLYLKTGIVSALVALVVALQVDFRWGAAYAVAATFGLANWWFLGQMLVAMTSSPPRRREAALCFCAKLALLGTYALAVLPQTGLVTSAFLCGFMMFLLVAVLEALGQLLASRLQARPAGRPLPRDLKSLFTGANGHG